MRERRRRLPTALLWLLAAILALTCAWALLVPAGQAPDEPAHFAYAQSIAESFERPAPQDAHDGRNVFSSDQLLARLFANSTRVENGRVEAKPEWSRDLERAWEREERQLGADERSDGGGANPAAGNPPLYYLYQAPAYHAAGGGSFFDQLYVMRIWSGLLLMLTATAVWLLIGDLFGRDRLLQLAGAAAVGLAPMPMFISSSVNPDAALIALAALALWLALRLLRGGFRLRETVALVVVTGAVVLVKPTSFALLPGVALVLAVSLWRLVSSRRPRRLVLVPAVTAAAALVGLTLVAAADRVASPFPQASGNLREFLAYLWQFYLPDLPFQAHIAELPRNAAYEYWVKGSWAAFGWLEVRFPDWVYVGLVAFSLVIAAGAVRAFRRGLPVMDGWSVAFVALIVAAVFAGVHLADYRSIAEEGKALAQGRYLLPLLPLAAVAVAAAATNFSRQRRVVAVGGFVGFMVVLQLFSLALVAGRFYA